MAHVTCDKCGDFGARKRDDGRRYCATCWDREKLARWNAIRSDERVGHKAEEYRAALGTRRFKASHYARYGLTESDFVAMYEAQSGRCAICGTNDPPRSLFYVDHDHDTGQTRDLLCGSCNAGLGQLKDDPEVAASAAAYLLRHNRPLGKRTVGSVTVFADDATRAAMERPVDICYPP